MTANWKITAIEAAQLLNMTRHGIYKAIRRGELEGQKIDGRLCVSLESVRSFAEQRNQTEQLLSCRQVGDLLGVGTRFVTKQVNSGHLRAVPGRSRAGGYLVEPKAVIAFWQEHMHGACIRCGIRGEAMPELGFMCVACEYEARTGTMYRWPTVRTSRVVQAGTLPAMGLVT